MTIHLEVGGKPYILLTDTPMPERALLCAWLVGMERPMNEGGVYLADYLRFVREKQRQGPRRLLE